jgi:hypothetical protein
MNLRHAQLATSDSLQSTEYWARSPQCEIPGWCRALDEPQTISKFVRGISAVKGEFEQGYMDMSNQCYTSSSVGELLEGIGPTLMRDFPRGRWRTLKILYWKLNIFPQNAEIVVSTWLGCLPG